MEMLISPTNDVADSIGQIDSKQKENNAIISEIRMSTLLKEYQLLQKYAPVGMLFMPADPLEDGPPLTYWKGVYFCK